MGKSKLSRALLSEVVFRDDEIQEYGISRKEVNLIITKFITTLRESIETLEVGGTIELRGFGTFGVKKRKPRIARNPKTGEPVEVDERKAIFFKPGRDMKTAIRKPED